MKQRFLTAVACLCVVCFTLTVSIALPIYFRPFYYMQIEELGLPDATGYSKEEIRLSYDAVLDYLTLPGQSFSTGVFPHSQEGADHFQDCKGLFDLNFGLLCGSGLGLVVLGLLRKTGRFTPIKPFGRHYCFSCGIAVLCLFAVIAGLGALDFNRAFVIFHGIFFPGKDNWLFNPHTDPIILAMPETFFLRCGILIVGSIILISLGMILRCRKNRNSTAKSEVKL